MLRIQEREASNSLVATVATDTNDSGADSGGQWTGAISPNVRSGANAESLVVSPLADWHEIWPSVGQLARRQQTSHPTAMLKR